MKQPNTKTIAKVLGCTEDQAKAGLRKSAAAIRNLTKRDLSRWDKTRQEANAIAVEYESRSH